MSGILEERMEENPELREKHEMILKRFFKAGVTPDFAQSSEDTEALEGQIYIKIIINLTHSFFLNLNSRWK